MFENNSRIYSVLSYFVPWVHVSCTCFFTGRASIVHNDLSNLLNIRENMTFYRSTVTTAPYISFSSARDRTTLCTVAMLAKCHVTVSAPLCGLCMYGSADWRRVYITTSPHTTINTD